ncbi:protein-glutamate methylesterase/protein-glutamine glutaminase [Aliiruegeria sabulilitoris]|uniref:protein-glutamate methylesterase/protein-glutamine glutaminase n=1 Tax=Aliiruegeria sabulilitoris TaxID=1510458 RepID=UPI000833E0FD|nr:chemotaxis response regulator protein-glutamate methylesterase [Aliiruegeria sabulilitoris]NDR56128.1 chemotaxis response regulator protein-glutamate methylesterase [Pseudoruegeria sp. M32A2M]
MSKKRVVIVDDSVVIRALVRRHLTEDGRFVVVGEAGDPFEAREVIKRVNPDVITLDVEMPRMDGLSFLEKLMRLRPLPVVMFSTETHKGSVAAVEALSLGAVDCIGKPNAAAPDTINTLADRVFVASNARIVPRQTNVTAPPSSYTWNGKYVLVGASTGGVDALERLLAGYPENCPPTVITQHMPESFLVSFAERLSNRVRPDVALAREGERLLPGMVRIAPGGENHLVLSETRTEIMCRLRAGEKVSGHRPSVDMLFRSAKPFASRVLAVLLTGMGRDGAYGMLELRQAGAQTIAQDRNSSVVYGMPRVATEIGGANRTLDLDRIAAGILEETGRGTPASPHARVVAK